MARPLLEMRAVSKCFRTGWTFRSVPALRCLSLQIDEGEVYGLIGHNGAGKTTAFKLLVGLLRPNDGAIVWDGTPLAWNERREAIGFAPEQPYFYDYLTVRETLNFYGQLYGMPSAERRDRAAQLAEQFRIAHKIDARMRTLSKGTLQRVAVAQAIMHRPRLAILDEPMSGLDPGGRKHMRDLIRSLRDAGTTVLFSSHILSDAEALCDRVAILADGRLQEVVDLRVDRDHPPSYSLIASDVPPACVEALERIAGGPVREGPEGCTVPLRDAEALRAALAIVQGTAARIHAVQPERPSLEQRFLQYAGTSPNAD